MLAVHVAGSWDRRGVLGAVKGFGYRISPINSRGYTHGTVHQF